jgi:hypothetical protein
MKHNTKSLSDRQLDSNLPLLNWRPAVVRPCPCTPAGQFLARRYRIDPAVADTIASLAGLGEVRA